MKALKLVLIAPFVCEQSVGEGASAYHWVSRLAKRFDVTLLTYNLRADPPASRQGLEARVVEWTDLPIVGRFPGVNSQLTPGYVPFYLRARRWLRRNMVSQRFDLVHQIAPLALRYPCPAAGLQVPYLIGPLGGSLEVPPPLKNAVRGEPLHRKLRNLDRLRFRFDPLLRASYAGARALILVAPYVRELLAPIALPPVFFMSEAGVEQDDSSPSREQEFNSSPQLLFVGRVIRTKGVREAIMAMRHLMGHDVHLDVVGGGEDLGACHRLVAELDLGARVRLHGHLPRAAVEAFYRRADMFVFPSFREPSGKAVLEALSHGLPVIAANHGGPAAVVDETCGRLVDPAPSGEFARRLAFSIDRLLRNPTILGSLRAGARKRIRERYTWDSKVNWMSNLYREVS